MTDTIPAPTLTAPPARPPKSIRIRFGRIDRVAATLVAAFVTLYALDFGQATVSLRFTAESLLSIAPFIAISVALAAYAKASGADNQIARLFGRRAVPAIVAAAVFGALSPFCSCGVVPIVAGLLGAGVPLAPVMAFWIASPIMDPEMFVLTAAVLGLPFAIAKTVAALGMGLTAGFATHALRARPSFADPLSRPRSSCGSCCGSRPEAPSPLVWAFWREPSRRARFAAETRETGWFLVKWLALAFLIESLMVAFLPGETVAGWLGGDRWWTIPAAVLTGIPAYLNGYAAIPAVARLLEMGMAPGAGLAFMVAGAVTSIPAAMAVFAIARRPVFFWYLLNGLVGSLIAGLVWQALA